MKFKLRPNETVEWRSTKGAGFWAVWCGGVMALSGILVLVYAFIIPMSAWGGLWLGVIGIPLGLIMVIYKFIQGKAVEFRLTNQRIVITKFGKITKEVSLKLYEGKPVSQFLQEHTAYMANDEPRYTLKILHPKTLDTIIHCKDIHPSALKILRKIGHVIKCKYCQTTNPVFNARCSHCGGVI